jgi:sulfur carrier protein
MPTIQINGEEEALGVSTVAELVAEKSDMPAGRGLAVALNGTLVRRADWANTPLKAGDAIEIVRAMQGG